MAVFMPTAEEEKERTVPIAIVVASYAGLAFANALHRRGVPYVVLELRMPPFAHVAGGVRFNVPLWDRVAKELSLDCLNYSTTSTRMGWTRRQDDRLRRPDAEDWRGGRQPRPDVRVAALGWHRALEVRERGMTLPACCEPRVSRSRSAVCPFAPHGD